MIFKLDSISRFRHFMHGILFLPRDDISLKNCASVDSMRNELVPVGTRQTKVLHSYTLKSWSDLSLQTLYKYQGPKGAPTLSKNLISLVLRRHEVFSSHNLIFPYCNFWKTGRKSVLWFKRYLGCCNWCHCLKYQSTSQRCCCPKTIDSR